MNKTKPNIHTKVEQLKTTLDLLQSYHLNNVLDDNMPILYDFITQNNSLIRMLLKRKINIKWGVNINSYLGVFTVAELNKLREDLDNRYLIDGIDITTDSTDTERKYKVYIKEK